MLKIINFSQGTPEWHDLRFKSIGASDAATVMGLNPWKTALQLYNEKINRTISNPNARMQRGIDLEPIARIRLSELFGIEFNPTVVQHSCNEWAIASLDALSIDHKYIVEIKCPGERDHDKAIDGQIPRHYYPQLQHQMWVCGLESAFYYSFDGREGVIIPVRRDEEFIEEMVDAETKFYNQLIDKVEPGIKDADIVQRHDHEWDAICKSWQEARSALKAAEEREEQLRKALINLADGNSCEGSGVKLLKYLRKGSVDYSKVPQLSGIDLDLYRKETTMQWRIS